jgi:hypothetical protein
MFMVLAVVVELFTSQGCSSCPPADRLLDEMARDERVIPLAFHVDYWDDLGWKDPYSSQSWSARQAEYQRALGSRLYTPQAVVGGAAEAVGSDRARLSALVAHAPAPQVAVEVSATRLGSHLLQVRAHANPKMVAGQTLQIAITGSGAVTEVTRGENAGRKLPGDHAVRWLGELPASGAVAVPVDLSWGKLEVVAFVQERKTMRIVGAAVAKVD